MAVCELCKLGDIGDCCAGILEGLVKNGCTFLPSRFIAVCTAARAMYRFRDYIAVADIELVQASYEHSIVGEYSGRGCR